MSSAADIASGALSDSDAGGTIASSPKRRNLAIDGLKYVAACSLVLHHVAAAAGSAVGNFLVATMVWALVFFFAVAGYFHGGTGTRGTGWLVRRLARLGVPYVVFSVVYLLIAQPAALKGAPLVLPNIYHLIFFAGAHGILWSLPMLFYCAVLAELVARNPTSRRIALVVCLLAVFALDWSSRLQAFTVGPLQNFWYLPRWFAAYLGGMEMRSAGALRPPSWWIKLIVPAAILGSGFVRVYGYLVPQGYPELASTTLWALTVFVLLWGSAAGSTWLGVDRLSWGGDFLVGIYVTHIIWLSILLRYFPPSAIPGNAWIAVAWAAVLALSTLSVFLMRSNRFTRPLID